MPAGIVTKQDDLEASSLPPEHLVRERLAGRYEILGLIGVGGMGSVYRARDFELDEIVALKMLRRELVASEEMLVRFRQEVKLARRVTHRNVARTFDIGEHKGEKFLTMEYVEGESLARVLSRGPLPIGDSVFIATEICAGLSAAHGSGVVHRDLKPDNVLIARDRRVVITDFGIARSVDPAAASLATMGVVTGTPAYMAPEQVEGGPIDARVDVYALGEILYEMLTGNVAWSGESVVQVAAARLHRPPPDPRHTRRDLPDAIGAVVVRAMARNPADRFATPQAVAEALAALTLPQVIGAPATPPSSAKVLVAVPASPVVPAPSKTPPTEKTLAVLVFRNVGPPDDVYLAEGLTEDLIDALSVVPGLRVRALGAVFGLGASDPREIGTKLDVQVIVDGSVRKVDDTLRVSVRVLSVADGFQLWARRFERPTSQFLEVGDEIANAIASALLIERKAPERHAPTDSVALELYLRARHELQLAFREGTQRAIGLFTEALRRAPHDPIIMSGYAMAQVREVIFGDNSEAAESIARSVVEEANRLAPDAPEPQLALAALQLSVGDSVTAARALRRAMSLARPGADAHDLLSSVLTECGPLDEAIRVTETALALEPRLYHRRAELGRACEIVGEHNRARELFDNAPEEAYQATGFWVARARWLTWRRDTEGAKIALSGTGSRAVPAPVRVLYSAIATGTISNEAEAVLAARMRMGRAKRRTAFFCLLRAEVLALIGQFDASLEAILAADKSLCYDVIWFENCPLLGAIRDDERFRQAHASVAERAREVRTALGY